MSSRDDSQTFFALFFFGGVLSFGVVIVLWVCAMMIHQPPTMSHFGASYPQGAPQNIDSVISVPDIRIKVNTNDQAYFNAGLHRDVVAHGGWAVTDEQFLVPRHYVPHLQRLESTRDYLYWFEYSPSPPVDVSSEFASVRVVTGNPIFEYQSLRIAFFVFLGLFVICILTCMVCQIGGGHSLQGRQPSY